MAEGVGKEKNCLSCTYYRVKDIYTGRCRIDKAGLQKDRLPMMAHHDVCDRWEDAGQNYYIRCGWVKSMKMKREEKEAG
ncbi:MAG: hypothetical protein CSA26_05460 [Desulfobacterales bacterium]|nr:MAG: hypothetical protein CSA26_05460 [Desulfobacterales bacterium]